MKNKNGFTLIEVIVVISIICLLYLGIGNSLIRIIDLLHLKNEAQKLALNLHNLRNTTLRLSQDGVCYFYGDNYTLKIRNYDGEEEIIRQVELPKNISMSGSTKLGFKFNGNALYSGTVIMKTSMNFQKKIIVAVATGRIRIE